jgi:hypothetical protein
MCDNNIELSVIFLTSFGRGPCLLILGKIIAKIVDLGISKKAGLSLDFWENCMIVKKISIWKRPSRNGPNFWVGPQLCRRNA